MAATAGAAVPATISHAEGGRQNGGASHVWCVRGARSLMLRGHGCGAERCSRRVPGFAAATGGVRECCRDRHPCWNWGLASPTPGLQSRGCWLLRRLLGRCSECSPETPTQVVGCSGCEHDIALKNGRKFWFSYSVSPSYRPCSLPAAIKSVKVEERSGYLLEASPFLRTVFASEKVQRH